MRILSMAFLLGLMALGSVSGRPDGGKAPATKPDEANRDQAAVTQDRLRREFDDLKQSLLRLQMRLENSPRPEDKARARAIESALQMVARQGTDGKFQNLIQNLRKSDAFNNLETMQQVMNRNQELRDDLRKLIDILSRDNREDQLRKEKENAQKTLEELKAIIAKQERVRASTELGKSSKKDLGESQKKVTDQTKDLAGLAKKSPEGKSQSDSSSKSNPKEGGKDSDKKGSDSKGKDDKEGKQKDGKETGKEGKKGDSKDKDKEEPGKDDKGSSSPPPSESGEQAAAKKSIKEATQDQEKAQAKIEKGDNQGAAGDQTQALDKLKQAQKKLEELLQQIREEEMKRLLAQLQTRCEKMLNMQISVKTSTEELDKAIKALPSQKPTRVEDQKALELSDAEDAIVREATAAIQLIEQEGSAIAFAEVFGQVRQDMILVAQKLKRTDAGAITQGIETDIIDSLKEMIAALKKARQEPSKQKPNQNQENSGGNNNNENRLLDQIAELKMIRSMQIRVNQRTTTYARQFEGEQPKDSSDPKVREQVDQLKKELFDLGLRQEKITRVTKDMALGRNKAQ